MNKKKIAKIVLMVSIVGILIAIIPKNLISLYWKCGLVSIALFLDFILISLNNGEKEK